MPERLEYREASPEHRAAHEDAPAITYRPVHRDLADLEHSPVSQAAAFRLLKELADLHEAREPVEDSNLLHPQGRLEARNNTYHTGNLWPSQTWLLNHDPHSNTLSPLNFHNALRHDWRAHTDIDGLNHRPYVIDDERHRAEQTMRYQRNLARQQGEDFLQTAREIADSHEDPDHRAQAARAMAWLVTRPAQEAQDSIGHPTRFPAVDHHQEQLERLILSDTLDSKQAAETFAWLRVIIAYSERLQSLRSEDPHNMYAPDDRARDLASYGIGQDNTLQHIHSMNRLSSKERQQLGIQHLPEHLPGVAHSHDPSARRLYDPFTTDLLQWAIDNDELDQWAELTVSGQTIDQVRETVLHITQARERDLLPYHRTPDPGEEIPADLVSWAQHRDIADRWADDYLQQLADTGGPQGPQAERRMWDWLQQEPDRDTPQHQARQQLVTAITHLRYNQARASA